MSYKELDLGCGKNKHPNAIGLDMNPGVNPDVLFEFKNRNLLPFANNSFDRVWAIDFIEHVSDISWLLSEIHRVCKPEAKVEIRYLHYSHKSAYSDVTHVQRLGIHCLDHFDPSTKCGNKFSYYLFFGRNFPFRIERRQLDFSNTLRGKISQTLSNLVGESIYENYLSNFFPINNVEYDLRVSKKLGGIE
ncbi:MAG: class I SAM-dependent methyltransferase [archaeon]|nr:class I SAM-dependent methyltransferase [archaeon]